MRERAAYILFVAATCVMYLCFLRTLSRQDDRLRGMRRKCMEILDAFEEGGFEDVMNECGYHALIYARESHEVRAHRSMEANELDQWNDAAELIRVSEKLEHNTAPVMRQLHDLTNGRHLMAIVKHQNANNVCVVYVRM